MFVRPAVGITAGAPQRDPARVANATQAALNQSAGSNDLSWCRVFPEVFSHQGRGLAQGCTSNQFSKECSWLPLRRTTRRMSGAGGGGRGDTRNNVLGPRRREKFTRQKRKSKEKIYFQCRKSDYGKGSQTPKTHVLSDSIPGK